MKTVSVMILALFGSVASLQAASPQGELLEFTAGWCVYCRDIAPLVSRLQREGLPIRQIDADAQKEELKKYGVSGLPTFVLVVNNREVERVSGAVSESNLRRMLNKIPVSTPAAAPAASSAGISVELGEPSTTPRPTPGQGVVAASATEANEPERGGILGDFSKLYRRAPKAKPEVRGQQPDAGLATAARDDRAHAASVRLQVVTADKRLQGSGTIIQSQAGRTLILTCGNLFAGAESAKIEVDFPDVPNQTYVGRLVKADLEADVGLVAINTDEALPTAPVAGPSTVLQIGDAVASFGASEGKEVLREQVRITALNKYNGPDNLECSGVPMQGRCGGGLFNSAGELIGICVASGDVPNTGFYCGLVAIHGFLKSCGLETPAETPAAPAVAADADLAARTIDLGTPRAMPAAPARSLAAADPLAAFGRENASQSPGAVSNAFHQQPASRGSADDEEIVVIVRSKNVPDAPSKVMVIHRASPKLKALLKGELDGGMRSDGPTQYAAGRRVTPAGGARIH